MKNTCTDLLASKNSVSNGFRWWNSVPQMVVLELNRNRYDFTNYSLDIA